MRNKARKYEECHKMINGEEYKLCSDCNEWFPMTEEYFYKNKSSKRDGYNTWCKICAKKRAWSNYKNDPTGEKKNKKLENMKEYGNTKSGLLKRRKAVQKWRNEGKQKEYYYNHTDKYKKYEHTDHDIYQEEWESCKQYFDCCCAYCGISETDAKKEQGQLLHKEHVIHNGANDLSNCIPACKSCNSQKNTLDFEFWYKERCNGYSENRFNKIIKWLEEDYKKFIEEKVLQ